MKQAAKTVVCLVLCVALVWGYSYKQPTEVHATAVVGAVVGAVAVAAALTALGICVNSTVTNSDYQTACQNIWNNINDDIKAKVQVGTVYAAGVYGLTTEFLTAVGNHFMVKYTDASATSSLSSIFSCPLSNSNYNKSFSTLCTDLGFKNSFVTEGNTSFRSSYNVISYSILGTIPYISTSDTSYMFPSGAVYFKPYSKYYGGYGYSLDGINFYYQQFTAVSTSIFGYAVALNFEGDSTTSYAMMSGQYASTQGASAESNLLWAKSGTLAIPAAPGKDVLGIDIEKWIADGFSALNNKVDDVVGRIGNRIGVVEDDGTIRVPVSVPSTDSVNDQTKSQTQTQTLKKEIATEQDKANDTTTNTGKDTTRTGKLVDVSDGFPKLVDGLKDAIANFGSLFSYLNDFFKFLAKCFSYFPSYVNVVFVGVVLVAIVVRIMGRGGSS